MTFHERHHSVAMLWRWLMLFDLSEPTHATHTVRRRSKPGATGFSKSSNSWEFRSSAASVRPRRWVYRRLGRRREARGRSDYAERAGCRTLPVAPPQGGELAAVLRPPACFCRLTNAGLRAPPFPETRKLVIAFGVLLAPATRGFEDGGGVRSLDEGFCGGGSSSLGVCASRHSVGPRMHAGNRGPAVGGARLRARAGSVSLAFRTDRSAGPVVLVFAIAICSPAWPPVR